MKNFLVFPYKCVFTLYDGYKILNKNVWDNIADFNKLKNLINDADDIYVLGNGPSLKSELEKNLEFYKNKDLICVNYMVKANYYGILKPKYYILMDPNLWYADAKYCDEKAKIENDISLNEIVNRTKWNMFLVLPIEARKNIKLLEKFNKNPKIKILFLNTINFRGFKCLKFWLLRNGICSLEIINVLVAAIYVGIVIGYKNIFILGADHDWMKEINIGDDNVLFLNDKHFYNKKGEYRKFQTSENERFNVCELYRRYYILYKQYYLLEKLSEMLNVKIWNATKNSLIDIFSRKEIK